MTPNNTEAARAFTQKLESKNAYKSKDAVCRIVFRIACFPAKCDGQRIEKTDKPTRIDG